MIKSTTTLLSLLALTVAACGDSNAPSTTAASDAEFVSMENTQLGYKIDVPKGAKAEHCDDSACLYSLATSDIDGFTFTVKRAERVKSLEDAAHFATLISGEVVSKQTHDGGDYALVVKDLNEKQFHYYAKGESGYVHAICSGPVGDSKLEGTARRACESLSHI